MKVEIWSDFVSPLCYIAKRKFELALEKFEQHDYVKVEYKSFLLHAKDRVKSEESKQLLIETCNIPVGKIEEWLEQVTNQDSELNLPLEINHFIDRKSTRLNSSHVAISYAVFCLKKTKCDLCCSRPSMRCCREMADWWLG